MADHFKSTLVSVVKHFAPDKLMLFFLISVKCQSRSVFTWT